MGVQPHRVSCLIEMSPNQPYQVQSLSNSQEHFHIEKHLHFFEDAFFLVYSLRFCLKQKLQLFHQP